MTPRTILEPDHESFRAAVRECFRAEVTPHVDRWRHQGVVDRESFRKAGDHGYLWMWAPEAYRGRGADRAIGLFVVEEDRDARVTRIFGGTSEIMAEIIDRRLGLDERRLTR